jgi:hypothetical protein
MQNQTSQGYSQFYETLNGLVAHLKQDQQPNTGVLTSIINDLGEVEGKLPPSETPKIEDIIQQLQALMKQ